MTTDRSVDNDEFRQALAPLVGHTRGFANAVDAAGNRHGNTAMADSPAMREIADEARFVQASGWTGAMSDTHTLGGMTLRAAADYLRTFAEAFAAERPPVYGHLVVARSALESSVVSWWLNEPGVAQDERVKRGLSEILYSTVEVQRLGLHPEAQAAAQVDGWIEYATKLGWDVTDHNDRAWRHDSRGKPKVGGATRPSIRRALARLLVDNEDARIGSMEWSRLSAVSHVTWFGLEWALSAGDAVPSLTPGIFTVPFGTNSKQVALQALCVVRALRQAATARATLMGWTDDQWQSDADDGARYEAGMIEAFRRAGWPGES